MTNITDFNYESFDWGGYIRHRPPYRPELYALIYDYHKAHSDRWDAAYDLGAGPGIVTVKLLQRFAHVTLSDPSANYVATARDVLGSIPPERLALAKHRGEDPLVAKSDSLDLVATFEAFHWMDPDVTLENVARYLRPNGTLAIVVYGVQFGFEDADPAVQEAYKEGFKQWLLDATSTLNNAKRSMSTMQARLDNVYFDPAVWKDVHRRHYIPDRMLMDEDVEIDPSRVGPSERVEQMPERDMFAVDADAAWIEGYFKTMAPSVSEQHPFRQRFRKLVDLMGDSKTRITYPAIVILATKR